MAKQPIVICPQCGKEVIWNSESRYRPFCSERCKLIDLGQWANEGYCIPENEASLDQPEDRSSQA